MAQNEEQRRASQAVAAWLAANGRGEAWLAREASADPATISTFLSGERWPKITTQGRIEKAIGWPHGTIHQIRYGGDVPVIPDPNQAPVQYVAAPGKKVEGDDESVVLQAIREVQDAVRDMSERLEKLEERRP